MINLKRELDVRAVWLGVGMTALLAAIVFSIPLYREWRYHDVADVGMLSRVVAIGLCIGIAALLASSKTARKNS